MIPSFIYSYRHFCSRAASVSPNLCEWTLILAIGHSLVQWHFQPQLSWWKKRNHSLWISVFGDLELPDNPCNKKEGKTKVELVVLSSIVYGSKCSRSYTTSILAYMSRGGRGVISPWARPRSSTPDPSWEKCCPPPPETNVLFSKTSIYTPLRTQSPPWIFDPWTSMTTRENNAKVMLWMLNGVRLKKLCLEANDPATRRQQRESILQSRNKIKCIKNLLIMDCNLCHLF